MQGNVIAILDNAGKVVVKYAYDAWGNYRIVGNYNLGSLNPFRYRSYYYDAETGFYYLKTRYYDPAVGRFINIDSIEYADPETINGLNLYAYCGNNPVMNIDPTGTFLFTFLLVLGGVLVSGAVTGVLAAEGREEGESYGGAFLGGFIEGVFSALSIAAGLATGNIFLGLGISAIGGFVGGFVGNITSQAISYGDVDLKVAAVQGGVSAFNNSIMYFGFSVAGMVSGSSWTARFIDALKISDIGVAISVFFMQFSFPSFNGFRWNI